MLANSRLSDFDRRILKTKRQSSDETALPYAVAHFTLQIQSTTISHFLVRSRRAFAVSVRTHCTYIPFFPIFCPALAISFASGILPTIHSQPRLNQRLAEPPLPTFPQRLKLQF